MVTWSDLLYDDDGKPAPICPILPRCSTGLNTGCEELATHWLVQPDGELNPGGFVCEAHGNAIIEEFAEKIDETWTLVKIRRT